MKWRPKGGKPLAVGCNAMLGRSEFLIELWLLNVRLY